MVAVSLYTSVRRQVGYGPYATFDEWPRALIDLIGDDADLRSEVYPYGLEGFVDVDHRSIWRIDSGSPLQQALLDEHALNPTNASHPKAAELIASVPKGWNRYHWDRCTWYTSPGYGGVYIEGVDLFLVAQDSETGDMIVLHEWIF